MKSFLLCDPNISNEVNDEMGPRPQADCPTSSEVTHSVVAPVQSK